MLNSKQLNSLNIQQYNKIENSSNINIILPQLQSQKFIKNEKQNKSVQKIENSEIKKNIRPSNLLIVPTKLHQIDSILHSPTVTITPDVSIITIQQQKDKKKAVSNLKKEQLSKAKSTSTLKPILYFNKKKYNSTPKLFNESSEQQDKILDTNNYNKFKNKKNGQSIESKEFGTQTKDDVIKIFKS